MKKHEKTMALVLTLTRFVFVFVTARCRNAALFLILKFFPCNCARFRHVRKFEDNFQIIKSVFCMYHVYICKYA